ncbi:DUF4870 domain-containing protein [Microbacterium sp. ZW T5_45]|uniref:DUF4870 domain-containing protein n=1 Tax=Microbacterium sp. ZW T5_45 TaxID=3378080 RepID=UPI003853F054
MSEGNIDDRRSAAGAGQSAYPPPPPSIPSASPGNAAFAAEATVPPADAVYTGPSAPQTPSSPIGQPGAVVPGYPAPGTQVPGYPGAPVGGYPGGPQPLQGYPTPGSQVASYGTPGQSYASPGYPAPGYAAPGYAVQGYPAPGQPYGAYGAYPVAPPSGRRFWALQFMYYIPLAGVLVVLIVALVQRSSARLSPVPLVRENARWAANWVLSYLFYLVVCLSCIIALGIAFGDTRSSGVIAIPVILLYAIGIYCLVTIIIGTVKADRFVHRPYLALPFFRS